jgi:copper transport protein
VTSVGALVASGLVNSWNLLVAPDELWTTDYGRLLMLKIGLFAAMVSIAAVNMFYLTPQLPAPAALRALQRNSWAEISLGLCVLIFAGALGTLAPTAHVHAPPTNIPPDAAFVHIHGTGIMADVTIDPGHTGPANVTIRVSREDFSRYPAKDVRLALDPPPAGGQKIERGAIMQIDGTWLVNGIEIAPSGNWTVRVIVTRARGEPIVLDGPIVIER